MGSPNTSEWTRESSPESPSLTCSTCSVECRHQGGAQVPSSGYSVSNQVLPLVLITEPWFMEPQTDDKAWYTGGSDQPEILSLLDTPRLRLRRKRGLGGCKFQPLRLLMLTVNTGRLVTRCVEDRSNGTQEHRWKTISLR